MGSSPIKRAKGNEECASLNKIGNMDKIKNMLLGRKIYVAIFSMIGLLGSLDIMIRNIQNDGNVFLILIKWFTICFLFSLFINLLLSAKNKIVKGVGIAVTILYSILCVSNAVSYLFWGFGVSSRMFTIIFETNERETKEFINYSISNFISPNFLIDFFVFSLITATLAFGFHKLKEKTFLIITVILGCAGVFSTINQLRDKTEKKNVNIILRSFLDFKKTKESIQIINETNQLGKDENYYLETLKGEPLIDNIVIVIGESASRNHHSLYGYNLKTTPLLESKKEEIIPFNDVIAAYSTTSESMKMFMTYKNSSINTKNWYQYPSIPTLFSELGYKTYWISNQEKGGSYGVCENFFSAKCDTSVFVGMQYTGDNLQEKFDDAILPELSEAMDEKNDKKLIILHMMGSHGVYNRRYPKEFAKFSDSDIEEAGRSYLNKTKKKLISEYDNSILYSDYIISNMIDSLKKHEEQKTLFVYFSDHGEEMYGKRDFAGHATGYVDIPFIIWVSDTLQKDLGEKYTRITESVDKPITIENLFDFLLGINDIQYQLYNPSLNFISSEYHLEKRFADDEEYHKGQCE